MRAMHPKFVVLGIPGINNWRSSWVSLVAGHEVRYALDRGKPRKSDGLISEDMACARIALDVARAVWQESAALSSRWGGKYHGDPPWQRVNDCDQGSVTATGGQSGKALGQPGAFAFPAAEATLDWLISRHRRSKSLFCVLCGAPEPWLCRGCGRRRAPVGMDWGEVWRLAR